MTAFLDVLFIDGLFIGDAAQIAPLLVRQAELVPGCLLASEMTVQGIPDQNRMAVPEPVSLCLHVTYAQVQTNNLGVSLNAVS